MRKRILSGCLVLISIVCFQPLLIFAQNNPTTQNFDEKVLLDIAKHRSTGQTNFFMFISKHTNAVNIALPIGLFTGGIIANDKGTRQNAMYIATSSAVNFIATKLIKKIVRRPRPFITNIKINAVYQPVSASFPSGHTSSAFTSATAISQVYNKWYVVAPAFLWAGSVGYSRMYLGVHYPTDVAAGALLGSTSALALKFLQPEH